MTITAKKIFTTSDGNDFEVESEAKKHEYDLQKNRLILMFLDSAKYNSHNKNSDIIASAIADFCNMLALGDIDLSFLSYYNRSTPEKINDWTKYL